MDDHKCHYFTKKESINILTAIDLLFSIEYDDLTQGEIDSYLHTQNVIRETWSLPPFNK
tara:strand:+ start:1249 stop:1425 length:177 start_codon:yes stop_codon:yes gene_type:complete